VLSGVLPHAPQEKHNRSTTKAQPCRCDVMPMRAMQSAAALFKTDNSCRVRGDHVVPLGGRPYYEAQSTGRRSLQSRDDEGDALEWPLGPLTQGEAGHAAEEQSVNGFTPRRTLQQISEFGEAREKGLFNRAVIINKAQTASLRDSAWLGGFEPLLMTCPLTGRKVSPEAVPEYAALAWRCDGFGFAWECLEGYKGSS
jgi:hypothetical protein